MKCAATSSTLSFTAAALLLATALAPAGALVHKRARRHHTSAHRRLHARTRWSPTAAEALVYQEEQLNETLLHLSSALEETTQDIDGINASLASISKTVTSLSPSTQRSLEALAESSNATEHLRLEVDDWNEVQKDALSQQVGEDNDTLQNLLEESGFEPNASAMTLSDRVDEIVGTYQSNLTMAAELENGAIELKRIEEATRGKNATAFVLRQMEKSTGNFLAAMHAEFALQAKEAAR